MRYEPIELLFRPSSGLLEKTAQDLLQLSGSERKRRAIDPLVDGMHSRPARDAERERRDATGKSGVRIGRSRPEPVRKAQVPADRAHGGEERGIAGEAPRRPSAEGLHQDAEPRRRLEVLERGGELIELRLVERTPLDDELGVVGDRVDRTPARD